MSIAVIAPFFTRRSYVERLQGVENVLTSSGYELVLYNVETVTRRDECLRTVPRAERVDGVLVLSLAPTDAEAERLAQAGVPIVFVDAFHESMNSVQIDDVTGARSAVEYCIELGHERVAYIGELLDENPFQFQPIADRYQGYREALANAGIPFDEDLHKQGRYGWREARRMANELLTMDARPTAIFAYSDAMAFGVLEAAQQLDLRVPQDLSVVGFDDVEVAQYFQLTTVRQPLYETGARGAELLLQQMGHTEITEPTHIVLPTTLVVRNTTASPGEDFDEPDEPKEVVIARERRK